MSCRLASERHLVDVPNPDGELSPGMYCTVELKIPRRTPSLIVPAGAIVFDRDARVTVGTSEVTACRNDLGVRYFRRLRAVFIISRSEGDQVLLTPPVDLEDGSKVQVRATSSAKGSRLHRERC